jgi:hypothetical protein
MAANLQVISGVLVLNKKGGSADVHFGEGIITGDVDVTNSIFNGPSRNFRHDPQVLVSPTRLTLSTRDNTSYSITRKVDSKKLNVQWKIDMVGLQLQVDYLVIGVPEFIPTE